MKTILQRVLRCSVAVDGKTVSSIERGLLVLVGISEDDTQQDIDYMVNKILGVKLFEDDNAKKWSKNVRDKEFEILCVSQFTLCHKIKKNKLDFHHAMKAEESKLFYNKFLENLKTKYVAERVKDGVFGAYMEVALVNDGPVTLDIISPKEDKEKEITV